MRGIVSCCVRGECIDGCESSWTKRSVKWVNGRTAENAKPVPQETIPYVRKVLEGEDDIWKEWCLRYFVMELPVDQRQILQTCKNSI